jgi:hypothetical protein
MSKEKRPFQKVRKTWKINPREHVKENKRKEDYDPCKKCDLYKLFSDACYFCELG